MDYTISWLPRGTKPCVNCCYSGGEREPSFETPRLIPSRGSETRPIVAQQVTYDFRDVDIRDPHPLKPPSVHNYEYSLAQDRVRCPTLTKTGKQAWKQRSGCLGPRGSSVDKSFCNQRFLIYVYRVPKIWLHTAP
jgi:hypothetical protein